MLEFRKDGKRVECHPIYGNGEVGQTVVLSHIRFGEDSSSPLANYTQPAVFVIKEKIARLYVLRDENGNTISVLQEGSMRLFDANEWVRWTVAHEKEKLRRKDRKIEMQGGHLDLLKDILVSQGVRLITKEQAEALGLPNNEPV